MRNEIKRKPYQTDLSDVEWQKIESCIPKPKTKRGRNPEPSAAILDSQSAKTTESTYIMVRFELPWAEKDYQ